MEEFEQVYGPVYSGCPAVSVRDILVHQSRCGLYDENLWSIHKHPNLFLAEVNRIIFAGRHITHVDRLRDLLFFLAMRAIPLLFEEPLFYSNEIMDHENTSFEGPGMKSLLL
jgi:hypothetical protein